MACLEDFNSIENLLMQMAWLQLSIELSIFLTKRMECCEMHMFGLPSYLSKSCLLLNNGVWETLTFQSVWGLKK